MRDVTALGGVTVMVLVTIVGVLAFWVHRKRWHAGVLAATVLLADASSELLKHLYGRPRPDLVPHGSYVYSASFPSGHSTLSAATFLTFAMLIASLEPNRATKIMVFVLAFMLLLAVGVSRVYLGVHWPSDVLAGWCLGAAWALAAWTALIRLGGRDKVKGPGLSGAGQT
jgi:undecaprenyl-diphosphatase